MNLLVSVIGFAVGLVFALFLVVGVDQDQKHECMKKNNAETCVREWVPYKMERLP